MASFSSERQNNSQRNNLSHFAKVIISFFLFYATFLIFSLPIFLLILTRLGISLIFKTWYRGQYRLVSRADSFFAVSRDSNVLTITFVAYVKGSLDIEELRRRLSAHLQPPTGRQGHDAPYANLLLGAVIKFGFMCWQKKWHLDFRHHVRLCPGIDEKGRVITEEELLQVAAKLNDKEWPEDKPRWEVLLVPSMELKVDEESQHVLHSVVILRIHHLYMDGVSALQFLRNCLADQPPPKLYFDPVNPPLPSVSFLEKAMLHLQVMFLGPYESLKVMSYAKDSLFYEGPLQGPKFLGRMKLRVTLDQMRKIRDKFQCTTQSVLHSCFMGALSQMARRKGFTAVPEQTLATLVSARLPYPNEGPHNRAGFAVEMVPAGNSHPWSRLQETNVVLKENSQKLYALLASQMLMGVMGLYPVWVLQVLNNSLTATYSVSNVPGIMGKGRLQGNNMEVVYGVPPLLNGMHYTLGVGYYDGSFCVGFYVDKSKIIGSQQELEEVITEFEKEIVILIGG